jgi:hypothetical protein
VVDDNTACGHSLTLETDQQASQPSARSRRSSAEP